MEILTESQAVEQAKAELKTRNHTWTYSNMIRSEVDNFVFGYIYDHQLQFLTPIFYIDHNNNECAILVHEE